MGRLHGIALHSTATIALLFSALSMSAQVKRVTLNGTDWKSFSETARSHTRLVLSMLQ